MARGGTKTVLFVGTANRARCRIAEAVFSSVAGRMGLPWVAASRGLAVEDGAKAGGPADKATAKVLAERRLSAPPRAPVPLTAADLAAADLVIVLNEPEHGPPLAERFPDHAADVVAWRIPAGPDAAAAIDRAVSDLIARLLGGKPASEAPPDPPAPAASNESAAKKGSVVKVGRETKGRRGKGVTIISDLPLNEAALADLAALLKGRCGSGGTAKDGRIEIQGDHRDRLTVELEKLGYRVKRSGG